jgi:hypothetical protein
VLGWHCSLGENCRLVINSSQFDCVAIWIERTLDNTSLPTLCLSCFGKCNAIPSDCLARVDADTHRDCVLLDSSAAGMMSIVSVRVSGFRGLVLYTVMGRDAGVGSGKTKRIVHSSL